MGRSDIHDFIEISLSSGNAQLKIAFSIQGLTGMMLSGIAAVLLIATRRGAFCRHDYAFIVRRHGRAEIKPVIALFHRARYEVLIAMPWKPRARVVTQWTEHPQAFSQIF